MGLLQQMPKEEEAVETGARRPVATSIGAGCRKPTEDNSILVSWLEIWTELRTFFFFFFFF